MITPLILFVAAGAPEIDPPPPFVFHERGAGLGIGSYVQAEGLGGGVAAADFDDDGDVDLFVPNADGVPDQLYRNLGDGRFEEIGGLAGVDGIDRSRVGLFFDHDGDGDLDLLVAIDNSDAESGYRLYDQVAPAQFEDITVAAGLFLPVPPPFQPGEIVHRGGMCAGDIDGDGDLDLYCAAWNAAPHLLVNEGGVFVDESARSGVLEAFQYGHQPMMADFDRDGRLDIYAAIDFLHNAMFINQGDRTFLDVAPDVGADNAMNDMGMTLGDVDNDGDLDVYITNIFAFLQHNILLRNDTTPRGGLAFTEVSEPLRVDWGGWGWGCTFLDADNDGWLDIAATNGWFTDLFDDDPSRLYWNRLASDRPFRDVSDDVGFNDTCWGSSLVAADLNRDGRLDLVQTTKGGPLRVLLNRPRRGAATGRWLSIKPRGGGANRFAIGAVVRVQAGGLEQMRIISAGNSYLGQEPAEAFFGLGDARVADVVTVEWPDGMVTVRLRIPLDRVMEIRHPDAAR